MAKIWPQKWPQNHQFNLKDQNLVEISQLMIYKDQPEVTKRLPEVPLNLGVQKMEIKNEFRKKSKERKIQEVLFKGNSLKNWLGKSNLIGQDDPRVSQSDDSNSANQINFRSNSELESIHEDVHLETPSATLETVAETGQSVQPNTKNQASSRRSQPADIEHSESTDNIGEMAPPRLPPGPGSNTQALSEPKNYLTST